MSQVPPMATPDGTRYVILDTPDLTPLGQLLRHVQCPDEVYATLVVRNVDTGALESLLIGSITAMEHDRARNAIIFSGTLNDKRRIEAYIFATPQTNDPEVVGNATTFENQEQH